MGKMNLSLVLGIIAGLIAILAAVAQWNEKKKQEEIAEKSSAEAKKANTELKQLQIQNLDSTKELADAYKQIASLQDKLLNHLTGGNNTPILKITITGKQHDNRFNGDYYILFFDIVNNGEYTLHNVKSIVNDFPGLATAPYIKYIRTLGMSNGVDTRPDPSEYHKTEFIEEFAAVPAKTLSPLPIHSTTISPQLSNFPPGYNVQFFWGNGSMIFFIHCVFKEDVLYIHDVEFLINGEKVDYHQYLITNIPTIEEP